MVFDPATVVKMGGEETYRPALDSSGENRAKGTEIVCSLYEPNTV